MTEHDKQNLNFLLAVSPDEFVRWYEQADFDDVQYAMELFAMAREELMMNELEDLTEAREVLSRFVGELK